MESKLDFHGRFFTHKGRVIQLRGVNLSGSTKQPYSPYSPSHIPLFPSSSVSPSTSAASTTSNGSPTPLITTQSEIENQMSLINERGEISFVGRPFPLSEAHTHLKRLKQWGFNLLRFTVTWEAIEHSAPGVYDEEYINYVVEVLKVAKIYGFRVFIDPHQDVWSRFTGGSGAPLWTLTKVGFDVTNFKETYAALIHSDVEDPLLFPKMIWPTNYFKLACFTMFTLFFSGLTFAPDCMIDGMNAQIYLQSHYFNSIKALAKAIKAAGLEDEVVLGYDTLNEPGMGLIGVHDITLVCPEQELRKGITPTPLQAMLLGNGLSVEQVEVWEMSMVGPVRTSYTSLHTQGKKSWLPGHECIWASHGVYNPTTGLCLKPYYFRSDPKTGLEVDFMSQFWKPFVNDFTKALRTIHQDSIIFVEPPVNSVPPQWSASDVQGRLCFAPHWYDGLTLITKSWNAWYNIDYIGFLRGQYSSIAFAVKFGEAAIKKCFQSQLRILRCEGEEKLGLYPTCFGEIGIPFDMGAKQAYLDNDYSMQEQALDANMTALEKEFVNFTLWNYCSDNTHEWGDGWNGEDLSIWSSSSPKVLTLTDGYDEALNDGARAMKAFVRPYPVLTNGTPKNLTFDMKEGTFTYVYLNTDHKSTEIYWPRVHFPVKEDLDIYVSCGATKVLSEEQKLIWTCSCSSLATPHKIVVQRRHASSRDAKEIGEEEEEEEGVCMQCSLM